MELAKCIHSGVDFWDKAEYVHLHQKQLTIQVNPKLIKILQILCSKVVLWYFILFYFILLKFIIIFNG